MAVDVAMAPAANTVNVFVAVMVGNYDSPRLVSVALSSGWIWVLSFS